LQTLRKMYHQYAAQSMLSTRVTVIKPGPVAVIAATPHAHHAQ
jgi:hypothetical protein